MPCCNNSAARCTTSSASSTTPETPPPCNGVFCNLCWTSCNRYGIRSRTPRMPCTTWRARWVLASAASLPLEHHAPAWLLEPGESPALSGCSYDEEIIMADLSQAALDNSTRLDAFTHRLTALAEQWQQAQDGVQQLEHHVQADTQTLLTHLETLEAQVHQAHDTVQTDVEALGHRLAEVSHQLETRQTQAAQEFHQTQSDLMTLEKALDGLLQEVDAAVQQAEDTLHGCAERAQGLAASLQELTRRGRAPPARAR